jgi:hypothetical protein
MDLDRELRLFYAQRGCGFGSATPRFDWWHVRAGGYRASLTIDGRSWGTRQATLEQAAEVCTSRAAVAFDPFTKVIVARARARVS